RIDHVNERRIDLRLDRRGALVHEIRGNRDSLGSAIDQTLCRRDERRITARPIVGLLQLPDFCEVARVEQDLRGMVTAELFGYRSTVLRVLLDALMPSHSTQQTDPAHTRPPHLGNDFNATTSSVVRIICLR